MWVQDLHFPQDKDIWVAEYEVWTRTIEEKSSDKTSVVLSSNEPGTYLQLFSFGITKKRLKPIKIITMWTYFSYSVENS